MSFQKVKTNSYCVGGKHRSSTRNIVEITLNKKLVEKINYLFDNVHYAIEKNQ